jgi:hypothetical protein
MKATKFFMPMSLKALQTFSGEGEAGTDEGNEGGTNPAGGTGDPNNGSNEDEQDPDPSKVLKYSDEDVNKLIDKKFAKWNADALAKLEKDKSRASMTEEERRAAELAERESTLVQKELKFTFLQKAQEEKISTAILDHVDYTDAEKAQASYDSLKAMIVGITGDFDTQLAEGIKAGIEERLAGPSPSTGTSGTGTVSHGAQMAKERAAQQQKAPTLKGWE